MSKFKGETRGNFVRGSVPKDQQTSVPRIPPKGIMVVYYGGAIGQPKRRRMTYAEIKARQAEVKD